MNLTLQRAYELGRTEALKKFASDDPSESMVRMLGGVHPGAAAVGAGFTAPEGYGLGSAARTGVSSLAGAGLGSVAGEGAGKLIAQLTKINPELAASIGKMIGGAAGGMAGADVGHQWARNSMIEDMHKKQMGGG